MTATRLSTPASAAVRCGGHFGAWRMLTALPAMLGSLLLLLVMLGWVHQWEPVVLLAWLALGAATLTPSGERIAVRVVCGFRRPNAQQRALLDPAWSAVLARCGLNDDELDLYVLRRTELNAYAVGGRSVAVTTAAVEDVRTCSEGNDHLSGTLCHELGRHATHATRFALLVLWLVTPCRFAARLVINIGLVTVGRRQPVRAVAAVAAVAVIVAVVQAVQAQQWAVAWVLSGCAVATVICPLADAAVCRRSEHAADRYAASIGMAAPLAAALRSVGPAERRALLPRLLDHHPSSDTRIARLGGSIAASARE